MGAGSSLTTTQFCLGREVACVVVRSLAGASQADLEATLTKAAALDISRGIHAQNASELLGARAGDCVPRLLALMGQSDTGRADFYEMFAVMVVCGKISAGAKVRRLFSMFDVDGDGVQNGCEAILMLRAILNGVAKATGGVMPSMTAVEAIWQYVQRVEMLEGEESLSMGQWVNFCSKTREVHDIGKVLDFNRGACRKALAAGTRAALPALGAREEDPALEAVRAAEARKAQEKTASMREQKRTATAQEGRSKFARTSVLKVKEIFNSIDHDRSGFVGEDEWRRRTAHTPLEVSSDTFIPTHRQQEGQISIVEVLRELYPFAGDADLDKMLTWVSEEPGWQGPSRSNRAIGTADGRELAATFQMLDVEGTGEMSIGDLSATLAQNVGLNKQDVLPMFLKGQRGESDRITASEFADTLMTCLEGDASIQSLLYAHNVEGGSGSVVDSLDSVS